MYAKERYVALSDDLFYLSPGHRDALQHANAIVFDQCLQDLLEVDARRDGITDGFLFNSGYLPRTQTCRYDAQFLKGFARAIAVVGWKLDQLTVPHVGSVAEGLAAHALLREAEVFAIEHDLELDLEPIWYLLFAGTTILTLFDPSCDGSTAVDGDQMTSLAFDAWFTPFNGDTAHLSFPIVLDDDMLFDED